MSDSLRVVGLGVEHRDPVGIGVARPRLSWRTEGAGPGWIQNGYQIEVTFPGESAWESGWVESDQSVLVDWPRPPLASRDRARLRVRVRGVADDVSDWSSPLDLEAGLLDVDDWSARFIIPDWDEDDAVAQPCPHLRADFVVADGLERARLYVSALGLYEVELNGRRVGDHVLAPGWTSYRHRLRYETHDVTGTIATGANAIGAVLAEGWYRGRIGWGGGKRNFYGPRIALLAQLELTYRDGTRQMVVTDPAWKASTGPLRSAEIYNGEVYDARQSMQGWSAAGFDASTWSGVRVFDHDLSTLVARSGPPVRGVLEIKPIALLTSPSGKTIIDFGQNLVGHVRIHVRAAAGESVTLRHAEVLADDELCTAPLRLASQTDVFISDGSPAVYEPRFTFHGFRYLEVSGADTTVDDVVAVVCHSDMAPLGTFSCSDERINRLHDNVIWGMRGNFVDIPTDCPQRDERLGWTGDICVFSPSACFLFDSSGFLVSWLQDLAADQHPDGVVPPVIPSALDPSVPPTAAWGDSAVIVPWVVYMRYGDLGVLADQYPSMKAWVDLVLKLAGEERLWNHGFQFGDWLDPAAPAAKPNEGRTDNHLVASAYLARSVSLLASTASLLGFDDEARHYSSEAAVVRDAFAREYVSVSGRVVSDSQTAYALALEFDLLPSEEQRARAGKRLAQLVRRAGYRIATGFVGTPLVCDALCSEGHAAEAYALLTQEECPSWLYPVLHGATTIWERWDGILPDGRVNPDQMNSFNHYALGAVADWLHRVVGGLRPDGPGYKTMVIAPVPGGGLTSASASHLTPYGRASSSWRLDGSTLEVTAVVPPNTSATVVLPGGTPSVVGSGTHYFSAVIPD